MLHCVRFVPGGAARCGMLLVQRGSGCFDRCSLVGFSFVQEDGVRAEKQLYGSRVPTFRGFLQFEQFLRWQF